MTWLQILAAERFRARLTGGPMGRQRSMDPTKGRRDRSLKIPCLPMSACRPRSWYGASRCR